MLDRQDPMDIQVVPPGVLYPEPCPWPLCASTNLVTIAMRDEQGLYQHAVQCQSCQCVGPLGDSRDTMREAELSAITKWNARFLPGPMDSDIESNNQDISFQVDPSDYS